MVELWSPKPGMWVQVPPSLDFLGWIGRVAQLVEHWSEKPGVPSASLGTTNFGLSKFRIFLF